MDTARRYTMSRPMLFLSMSLPLAMATAGGCGESDPSTTNTQPDVDASDAGLDFAACEAQHVTPNADGDTVISCDTPFASAPRVKLPDDDKTGAVATLFGAFDLIGSALVLRDGSRLAVVDDHGAPLSLRDADGKVPASLRIPSNRTMYMLYRITGSIAGPTVHVLSGTPLVMIPGQVLDGAMLGVWEGTTTTRKADGWFTTDRVPLRVRLSQLTPAKNLDTWTSDTALADGTTFRMTGEIENLNHAVKGSDGTCYPALSSLGDANPFHGATSGAVAMHRLGGMHAPGDNELVFTLPNGTTNWSETAMSQLGPFAPADWISTAGGATTLHLRPHGAPKGNVIELHHIDAAGGGGGC